MEPINQKKPPHELSDYELIKIIESNTDKLEKNLTYSPTGIASPVFFTSKIDLCYNELNKRNNERFLHQVNRLNEENERSGKINFRLNIITIFLAIVSIILSIITLFK